jgi:hypothetical protein
MKIAKKMISICRALIIKNREAAKVLLLLMTSMSLLACGSQPAQIIYKVPVSIVSQLCYVSQSETYIWLEQEDEWLSLPEQTRQQLEQAEVNWLEENVLIVSQGQKPSAGYGIELTNWLLEQNHWQVTRIAHQPAGDSMQAQMMTSPCLLVKIPKSIKSFTLNGGQGQTLGRWPY